MTAREQRAVDNQPISDAQVLAHLRANPDFLVRHPSILEALHLDHESGEAVSLMERQIAVLRGRNIDMRAQFDELVRNARSNDALFTRTRALILTALEATTLAELTSAIRRALTEQLSIDSVTIILLDPDGEAATAGAHRCDDEASAQAAIGSILNAQQAVCGVLREGEAKYLFQEEAALPASAAVVPLAHNGRVIGVLGLGSRDPQRFVSGMGTMFLGYLADVLARLIDRLAGSRNATEF